MLPPFNPTQLQVAVVQQAVVEFVQDMLPAEQLRAALLQTPFTGHAAFAYEHWAEFAPPYQPEQYHVRVVQHDVAPLSVMAEPAEQPRGAALLHAQAIAALQVEVAESHPYPEEQA